MQHDDLRVIKEPQGELGVADSAGDNQSRPLSKAAPGVLWAQTLTGGEHRPVSAAAVLLQWHNRMHWNR